MEKHFENMEAFTKYCTSIETALKRSQITETEAMETFFSVAEDYWKKKLLALKRSVAGGAAMSGPMASRKCSWKNSARSLSNPRRAD